MSTAFDAMRGTGARWLVVTLEPLAEDVGVQLADSYDVELKTSPLVARDRVLIIDRHALGLGDGRST